MIKDRNNSNKETTMQDATTYTTRNGKTFASAHTIESATRVLEIAQYLSSFGRDLLKAALRGKVSEEQGKWLRLLAEEIVPTVKTSESSAPAAPKAPETVDGFRPVVEMLVKARNAGLKYPKIRIQTEAGQKIVVSIVGARSEQHAGSLNVTDGRPFGENTWFGRITPAGKYSPTRAAREAGVVEALQAFASNPAEGARLQGRLTSNCCFCGRALDTKESVGVGYGPVCAEKFGLPWGETEAYDEVRAEIEAELFAAYGEHVAV